MDQGKIIWANQAFSFPQFAREFSDHPEEWLRNISNFLAEWYDSGDFVKTRTSGSTGKPKIIELSKQTMQGSALRTIDYLNLKKGTHAFNCLPASYIAGRMMLVRSIVGNWNLNIDVPSTRPTIPDHIEFTALTPPQLDFVLSLNQAPKVVLVGGAPVSRNLEARLIKNSSIEVYLTYGMTETASHVALRKLNGDDRSDHFRAIPGVRFTTNEHRQLIIHADYINHKPLITHDAVDLISETEFFWLGRLDNVINSGGIKLHPEKIEAELGKILTVPFFVAAMEDDKWGEVPALVVEKDADFSLQWDQINLNRYEIPKVIIFVRKLRLTVSGKMDRKTTLAEENITQRLKIKP